MTGARHAERRPGWRVYLLRCRDGSLYAGAAKDLAARVRRHESGQASRYTRSRLPVALVYQERAKDRGAALRREAELKRLDRAGKLALVAGRRKGRGRGAGVSARRGAPRRSKAARSAPRARRRAR